MPKIDAPTVAEHHVRRRAAVIAAARHALGSGGVAGVTPGAVAKRAGLARTSVYQYFPSTESLLTAAIQDMFADAGRRIVEALAGSADPWHRVRAYITVALRAAAGEYGPFHGIAAADLPEGTRTQLRELHQTLAAPLAAAVAELGAPAPQVATALILGAVGSGITMVRGGAELDRITRAVCDFVAHGLALPEE